jgi:hypothetical protein
LDKENVVEYTMEDNSAIKKNEIMSFAGKRIELEIIMLTKISQAQKEKHCMVLIICGIYTMFLNDVIVKSGLFVGNSG